MPSGYSIEDIVAQTDNMNVCHVINDAGQDFEMTRLLMTEEACWHLKENGLFLRGLAVLKTLRHGCLRGVVDGGLDEVDGMPWVVTPRWEGTSLSERFENGQMSEEIAQRVWAHGKSVIEGVKPWEGVICFSANTVVETTDANGQKVESFWIDSYAWFDAWSRGEQPGQGVNGEESLRKLHSQIFSGLLGGVTEFVSVVNPKLESGKKSGVALAIAPHGEPYSSQGSGQLIGLSGAPNVAQKIESSSSHWTGGGLLISLLALALCSSMGFFWWIVRQDRDEEVSLTDLEVAEEPAVAAALNDKEEEERVTPNDRPEEEAIVIAEGTEDPAAVDIFGMEDEEKLIEIVGEDAVIQACVLKVSQSNSGKTGYLEFTDSRPALCAAVKMIKGNGSVDVEWLEALEGKEVNVSGRVELQRWGFGDKKRVCVKFREKEDLVIVSPSE